MPDFSEFADKAKDLASDHPQQADDALREAGQFADKETGGRYDDQVEKAEQEAGQYLGGHGQGGGQDEGGSQDEDGQN